MNNNILPKSEILSFWCKKQMKLMDLIILELQNARGRELNNWTKLFKDADPRFVFKDGKKPDGADLWILKAVWDGDDMDD